MKEGRDNGRVEEGKRKCVLWGRGGWFVFGKGDIDCMGAPGAVPYLRSYLEVIAFGSIFKEEE